MHDDWNDWETWEASQDVIQGFPYHKTGQDLEGSSGTPKHFPHWYSYTSTDKKNISYHPTVYIIEFGKWNYREWALKSDEKIAEFWTYIEQCIRRHKKDADEGKGAVDIVDWDGFSLSNHASKDGEYAVRNNWS